MTAQRSIKIGLALSLGILAGLSGFTFYYARGLSYFHDDPRSCNNCHIMREQFDAWNRSTHKHAATCNSCHTPKNLIGKYAVKGLNGWNHSAAFTLDNYHEPIQIRPFNRRIAMDNCVRCHKSVISRMAVNARQEKTDCITCHGSVGHPGRK